MLSMGMSFISIRIRRAGVRATHELIFRVLSTFSCKKVILEAATEMLFLMCAGWVGCRMANRLALPCPAVGNSEEYGTSILDD